MDKGRFGIYGGQYISETLMNELIRLEEELREQQTLIRNATGSWIHYSGSMQTGLRFYIMRQT